MTPTDLPVPTALERVIRQRDDARAERDAAVARAVPDGHTRINLEVVGKRPANTPYLRIADGDGNYLGSLDETEMRELRDAITKARPLVEVPDD